ncbi:MAG: 50S ribosomal protein L11 methyltransferase [Clostridia bacterium]|nr:50S ribosomal protein L11 methyltransferase [Clostridia bacterium]
MKLSSNKWIRLKTTCKREYLDTVSAVMEMIDNGIMVEDYSDIDELLDGVYGDLIDESILNADRTVVTVSVFLPEEKFTAETKSSLAARLSSLGVPAEVTVETLDEDDWANSWKKYYHPIRTGEHIVIVPSWEEFKPGKDDVVVLMDPGMAFGTGTHETTRLCAALLERYVRPGCSMIDVGCGSGILAITASKLGAKKCFACDIDPEAIRVARGNVKLNGTDNVRCEVSDLVRDVAPIPGGYDVAAVNIVADVIIRLAPDLGRYLAPGGVAIFSGIIDERADEVVSVIEKNGFRTSDAERENGWFAFAAKKADRGDNNE